MWFILESLTFSQHGTNKDTRTRGTKARQRTRQCLPDIESIILNPYSYSIVIVIQIIQRLYKYPIEYYSKVDCIQAPLLYSKNLRDHSISGGTRINEIASWL